MTDLPDALVSVLSSALMDVSLRGGFTAPDSRRTQPFVLRPFGVTGPAQPAATTGSGLTSPSERRVAVHPDHTSRSSDAAILPVQRLEEPRLQHLETQDPRSSLDSRVLRGSIEPA